MLFDFNVIVLFHKCEALSILSLVLSLSWLCKCSAEIVCSSKKDLNVAPFPSIWRWLLKGVCSWPDFLEQFGWKNWHKLFLLTKKKGLERFLEKGVLQKVALTHMLILQVWGLSSRWSCHGLANIRVAYYFATATWSIELASLVLSSDIVISTFLHSILTARHLIYLSVHPSVIAGYLWH